jgi:DNA-binding HxlR family transcriptional regulator
VATARDDATATDGDTTIGGVLRLLSSGAGGAILLALGGGPLRTKALTESIPGYAPRTTYRYAARLSELGVLGRIEEAGVPTKVVYRLTDPRGRELYELIDSFASTSLSRLPGGAVSAQAWDSLRLLADLWESGIVNELCASERSPTELARVRPDLSYHQINRRARLFVLSGLVSVAAQRGTHRRYALTPKARRWMLLIAGVQRWLLRGTDQPEARVTTTDVETMLRAALPLVRLPGQAGASIEVTITNGHRLGVDGNAILIDVRPDGAIETSCRLHAQDGGVVAQNARVQGRARGWLAAIIDGNRGHLTLDGDHTLATSCLEGLHAALSDDGSPPICRAVQAATGPGGSTRARDFRPSLHR